MDQIIGTLFRKYLRGAELPGPLNVKIVQVGVVEVRPHPQAEPQLKGCVWVDGLPENLPCGILFGPNGEKDLVKALGGQVRCSAAAGKTICIAPVPIKVAGQNRISIQFRPAMNANPSRQDPPPQRQAPPTPPKPPSS